MQFLETKTATIAASGTDSSAVPVRDALVACVDVPTLDSTTLKIQGSIDGGATFRDLYDDSGQICTMTASTGNRMWGVAAQMAKVMGLSHIRFIAGSAQTGGARTITVSLMK